MQQRMYIPGAVWLTGLFLSFAVHAVPDINLGGDVSEYYAESNTVVGYSGDTWFTTTSDPDAWIYLRNQPLAAGSLSVIKMLGSNQIKAPGLQTPPIVTPALAEMAMQAHPKDPAAAPSLRNYNRLKNIQIWPTAYAQPGAGKVSMIYITTDGNVQPNGWALVGGKYVTLANGAQAAAATYAMGKDKPISYDTRCGWVLNIGSGQLQQICNMASWIQVD